MKEVPITEVAAVIRSKNAGPFELTLDIMFNDPKHFHFLKKINFFTPELFARQYGVDLQTILKVVYFDPACAVKCTMARTLVSGALGDSDVYGAQQHAPLLFLKVPLED